MEPNNYRASDHNKTQLFTQKCSELIEEMESLNTATKEWNGKVGFSNGRFYSTGFAKHTEAPQRQLSYLEQAKAKASGAISRIQEKAYRQIWRASTTATLRAIDTLRVDIANQITLYKETLNDPSLQPAEINQITESYKSLIEELQKTKEEGLKRLKERYENVPSGKGDQESIRRAHDFRTIYDKFTTAELEQLSDEDLKTNKQQRANRQIIVNGKDYTANLTALPHVNSKQLLVVTDKIIFDAVYDATFRDPKQTKKSQLEQNTFEIKPYFHVPDLIPQGGRAEATWVSKRCLKGDAGFETSRGEVYSTAERAEVEKELKKAKKK